MEFDHERLDVYRLALAFVVVANDVAQGLPRGRSYLADQLQRAATSVILNLAEGAGEYSANDKARFYRMSKRSATECAAILDVCKQLEGAQPLVLGPRRPRNSHPRHRLRPAGRAAARPATRASCG
jgi:four helix bundle protein